MATIQQEIGRAKTVQVLLASGYSDGQPALRATVSKAQARRIVEQTPAGCHPTPHWDGDWNLVLVPNAARK